MMDRRKFFAEALAVTSSMLIELPKLKEVNHINYNNYKAIFLRADMPNGNNRIYPKSVLNNVLNTLNPIMSARGLIGELGQPNNAIIHFSNASHLITSIKWNDEYLEADIEILNTPSGNILKELLGKNTNLIAFRSRGIGNGVVDDDGIFIVGDSYKMITIDALQSNEAAKL